MNSWRMPHPILMMVAIIMVAVALTYVVPSGLFDRSSSGLVTPGSYHEIAKLYSWSGVLGLQPALPGTAAPASLLSIATAIPAGMLSQAGLIFMILFIGGMFGVLRETNALDAGIERLLILTGGRVHVLAPIIMMVISAGGSFLGLISEYLVIIPMVVALAARLGLGPLFATALVTVAAKIGFLASVTNPAPLLIGQTILGLPIFSGSGLRLAVYLLFMPIGILYVLRLAKGATYVPPAGEATHRLSVPHIATLLTLVAAVVLIIHGAGNWSRETLSTFYLFLSAVIALINRLPGDHAAEAFLTGMKNMVLAGILVGLAGAVEYVLKTGLVLDTIVNAMTSLAEHLPTVFVAQSLVVIEMIFDVLIPSTSGKAAVSLPILGPIAQLSGVSGQTTMLAFLFGNGLTNMVTPTSGMLLAFLATGGVSYSAWMRFVLPLFALLTLLSLLLIAVAAVIGY